MLSLASEQVLDAGCAAPSDVSLASAPIGDFGLDAMLVAAGIFPEVVVQMPK